MVDLLTPQLEHTVQTEKRDDALTSVGLLYWMAQAGTIISPWWSTTRDRQLRAFWKDCNHFAASMYMISSKLTSVPWRVEPRDMGVKAHHVLADYFNALLSEGIQFGAGWSAFWEPFLIDLWTMDNGAHAEIIGAGDPTGPIEGPVVGLAHLDSSRCTRTSNPEYPVLYQDRDGKRYKFHYTRVMSRSQLPSPAAEMNSVGHCWLTRSVNKAQELIDQSVYKQEKLGSRPLRSILFTPGLMTHETTEAVAMAEESMDSRGLTRFAKTVVIGTTESDARIEQIDLVSLPDGFDEATSTELGMYLIAVAGGFPPRWLWPATTTGATKADALYQHISGTGGGASWHLRMMQRMIGGSERGLTHIMGKVLPPTLRIIFDYQDDEQDRMRAENQNIRAQMRRTNLEMALTTIRVERERMLAEGEITEAQFAEMELQDGRLPSGDDILTLFASPESDVYEYLELGMENPLLISQNDPAAFLTAIETQRAEVLVVVGQAASKKEKERALRAVTALDYLRTLYERQQELLIEEVVEEEELMIEEEHPPLEDEQVGMMEDEE